MRFLLNRIRVIGFEINQDLFLTVVNSQNNLFRLPGF
jgi:hypothetical protein